MHWSRAWGISSKNTFPLEEGKDTKAVFQKSRDGESIVIRDRRPSKERKMRISIILNATSKERRVPKEAQRREASHTSLLGLIDGYVKEYPTSPTRVKWPSFLLDKGNSALFCSLYTLAFKHPLFISLLDVPIVSTVHWPKRERGGWKQGRTGRQRERWWAQLNKAHIQILHLKNRWNENLT